MPKRKMQSGLVTLLILSVTGYLSTSTGCRNSAPATLSESGSPALGESSDYINFRSFQNPDLTWGFTIFVNSRPYCNYNRIPYKNISFGFVSRNEAEQVANLFVTMIRNGNESLKLTKNDIDTLRLTLNKRVLLDP